jgi:xanthine dehydrogenase YagR molybdenum-binding subunit
MRRWPKGVLDNGGTDGYSDREPISRVDGRLKVTGQAKYAAEFDVPGLIYGVVVSSSIARGRITKIHIAPALAIPGVLQIFTHENRLPLPSQDKNYRDADAPGGSPFRPLYSAEIFFSGQPIALVTAESFEVARYAASLIQVDYERDAHQTDLRAQRYNGHDPSTDKSGYEPPPKPWGRPDEAFSEAPVQMEAEYHSPVEHHNPIELFSTTAVWNDDRTLTVYDKTQRAPNNAQWLCKVFGLKPGNVRLLSPYVGGAFGSGLRPSISSSLLFWLPLSSSVLFGCP